MILIPLLLLQTSLYAAASIAPSKNFRAETSGDQTTYRFEFSELPQGYRVLSDSAKGDKIIKVQFQGAVLVPNDSSSIAKWNTIVENGDTLLQASIPIGSKERRYSTEWNGNELLLNVYQEKTPAIIRSLPYIIGGVVAVIGAAIWIYLSGKSGSEGKIPDPNITLP